MTQSIPSSAGTPEPGSPFVTIGPEVRVDRPPAVGRASLLRERLRRAAARGPGPRARLGRTGVLAVGAIVGLVAIAATDQIVPATSVHQAQVRLWVASRAAGITSLTLLAIQILIGLVLSHPTNKATWRLSKWIFPWHDNLWVFVLAFTAAHVVTIVADPYAGVGLAGSLVPGLSSYRSAPVALGTLALYAMLVTGISARWTRLLPAGTWLVIHRMAAAIFVVAWMHGLLAGTDSAALLALYLGLGVSILAAVAHRVWTAPPRLREARR